MTDLSLAGPQASSKRVAARRLSRTTLLCAAAIGAGAAGILVGRTVAADPAAMEWQLVLLLRFMAAVKGALAVGALALAAWRMRQPASDRLALGYGASVAAMAAAPGLIWSLGTIAAGAATFHAGLILYLLLAWRDEAVTLPARR